MKWQYFSPRYRGFHFKLWLRRPDPEESLIWSCFWHGVPNLKPQFLSPTLSKPKNFSAHQKENFLRFSKLTLHLFLLSFLVELWPVKHGNTFLWHPEFHGRITKTHILNFTLWSLNSIFSGQEWAIFTNRECFGISISCSFHWHHSQVCWMNT